MNPTVLRPRTWKPAVWCSRHNVGCQSPICGPGFVSGGEAELCVVCERERVKELSGTEAEPNPVENVT